MIELLGGPLDGHDWPWAANEGASLVLSVEGWKPMARAVYRVLWSRVRAEYVGPMVIGGRRKARCLK